MLLNESSMSKDWLMSGLVAGQYDSHNSHK